MRRPLSLLSRVRALLGLDAAGVGQSLVALVLNSSTSFVAGAFLGAITGTLSRLPGLLVLVPAAIGLRGNIFGSFGNRISTSIHSGTFRLSTRRDTVLGQNVLAAMILTFAISMLLAFVAKIIAVALGLPNTIPVVDLATISIVGGTLGSLIVLGATLGLTAGAVRYDWDLDNLSAPLVGVLGDAITLPALWLATFLVGIHYFSALFGWALMIGSAAALIVGLRSHLGQLRRILRESVPVLVLAGSVSAMAGITLEKQFDKFQAFPALLILVAPHLSTSGALGGILSGRLATKLFLGTAEPTSMPGRAARADIAFVAVLALPMALFNAIGAHYVGRVLGQASPGLGEMIAISLLGGVFSLLFVVLIAYYGTIAAYRTGLDPDTYGIPITSSSLDFVGAIALITAIVLLGVA
jgi:mgtE-like transporter